MLVVRRTAPRWAGWLASGLLLHSLAGCYSSGFPDAELPEQDEEEDDPRGETIADAGPKSAIRADSGPVDAGVPPDAGPAERCTGTDPIALLICNLTRPPAAAQPTSPIDTLTGLLNGLGGLTNIAQVLGSFLGTTPPTNPTTPTAASGLTQLINLAGGLANIAQLLNGVLGQAPASNPLIAPWAQLFGIGTTPNTTPVQPSLADILRGLGIPTLGPAMTAEPSADQCQAPTNPVTQFICLLQQANGRNRR